MQQYQPPILISRFNDLEILHVARRKTWLVGPAGQPLLSPMQFQAGISLFEQDLAAGVLARLEVDYDAVFDAAMELSQKHGQAVPVKTADLLHLAIMDFGFDHFVTADKQQHDFAIRVGIHSILLPL